MAIFVRYGRDFSDMKLKNDNPNIEIAGVKIHGPKDSTTIVDLYKPDGHSLVSEIEYSNIFRNINENIILLGDFNVHNRLWEPNCTIDDAPSKEIVQFINTKGLVLLNDGSPTRHDINEGRLSALDLTFVSPNLSGKNEWKAHDHLLGSDHYPVILEVKTRYKFTEYKPQPR